MASALLLFVPNLLAFFINILDFILWKLSGRGPLSETGRIRSVEVGKKQPGEGRARRHPDSESVLVSTPFEGVNTLADLWNRSARTYANKQCMGYRKLDHIETTRKVVDGKEKEWKTPVFGETEWATFAQVDKRVQNVASGLKSLGLKTHDVIGIYEETRAEWMIAAQACFQQSLVLGTVYANLGDEALAYAINQCEMTVVIANGGLVRNLEAIAKECPNLKTVIYVDDLPKGLNPPFETISFQELERRGAAKPLSPTFPKCQDLAVIMYTSGTSGLPKGVMLSHGNVLSAVGCAEAAVPAVTYRDGTYLAFLPLAHVLELVVESAIIAHGVRLAYGNPRTLTAAGAKPMGDLQAFRPTLMAGVPRIWDTIKKEAMSKIEHGSPIVRWLFKTAFAYKSAALKQGRDTPVWNRLVFNKFKGLVGGRVQTVLSGGAPLNASTQEFLAVCFGCPVLQGYGLTETCGASAIQAVTDLSYGRVGGPTRCVEIKLVDCPDLGYVSEKSEDPDHIPAGEVWMRGPPIAQGYFKQADKTAEAFIDGWFATGDIGQWHKDGVLQIIDRKKNLVKLSFGEYVALEKLESLFGHSALIQPGGICVYGDSFQDHVVALILPHKNNMLAFAKQKGFNTDDYAALLQNRDLRLEVLKSLEADGKKANLKSYELIKNCRLFPDEWTPENECVTSSMKLKRDVIKKKYGKDIEAMYAGGK